MASGALALGLYEEEKLVDLQQRSVRERKRFAARRPKRAGDVVANLLAKRGYAASKAADNLQATWTDVASQTLGEAALAGQTRAAGLSRGRLEVLVANHVVMQEINFHRPQLLAAVQQAMPEARITAIRFKVSRF